MRHVCSSLMLEGLSGTVPVTWPCNYTGSLLSNHEDANERSREGAMSRGSLTQPVYVQRRTAVLTC